MASAASLPKFYYFIHAIRQFSTFHNLWESLVFSYKAVELQEYAIQRSGIMQRFKSFWKVIQITLEIFSTTRKFKADACGGG